MTHNICELFDEGFEVKGGFLAISKEIEIVCYTLFCYTFYFTYVTQFLIFVFYSIFG